MLGGLLAGGSVAFDAMEQRHIAILRWCTSLTRMQTRPSTWFETKASLCRQEQVMVISNRLRLQNAKEMQAECKGMERKSKNAKDCKQNAKEMRN